MVEIVATAAKVATAAPVMVEGAAIASVAAPAAIEAANVATVANTAGIEALKTATTVAETVPRGTTAAVEVGAKAAEVTPEAAQAAGRLDSVVDAGGTAAKEAAMEELVTVSPVTAAETIAPVTEVKGVMTAEEAKLAAQRQEEILRTVQPQITEWEQSHPPGNDIEGWIEQRAVAEKQFTVNEGVNRDLTEWKGKEENRMPDKDKNPEDYAKWEKRLAARESESRQANEASYEKFLAEQEEKKQGMSKQEFMRRYAELLQKRAIADNLAMRLQKLRMSPHQTTMRKEVLTRAEAQLEDMRADITTREAELQFDAINSRSLWKQYIIPVAVGVAMVAGPMAAEANEV